MGVEEEEGVEDFVGAPLPVAFPGVPLDEAEVKGLGEEEVDEVPVPPSKTEEGVVVVEDVGEVDLEGWRGEEEALSVCFPTPPPPLGVSTEVTEEVELPPLPPPPLLDDPVPVGLVERVGASQIVGVEEVEDVTQGEGLEEANVEEEKVPLPVREPLTVVQEVGEAVTVGVEVEVRECVPLAVPLRVI